MKQVIGTNKAPQAIGAYSQAIKLGNTVYISGQIPLDPKTMELVENDFKKQVQQVLNNLTAVAEAAGGSFANIVKLTVFLTRSEDYAALNEMMNEFCQQPFPARSVVFVSGLPKGVPVEIEAIMMLGE
jgi:reactive intermediate/imine deaminase